MSKQAVHGAPQYEQMLWARRLPRSEYVHFNLGLPCCTKSVWDFVSNSISEGCILTTQMSGPTAETSAKAEAKLIGRIVSDHAHHPLKPPPSLLPCVFAGRAAMSGIHLAISSKMPSRSFCRRQISCASGYCKDLPPFYIAACVTNSPSDWQRAKTVIST